MTLGEQIYMTGFRTTLLDLSSHKLFTQFTDDMNEAAHVMPTN